MISMKYIFKKIYHFIKDKHLILPIIAILMAIIFMIYTTEYRSMVISAVVGFIFGKALIEFSVALYLSKEDQRKAFRDYDSLNYFYDEDIYGNKQLVFPKNKNFTFFYEECFINKNDSKIIWNDFPQEYYELPPLIYPYYLKLFDAHQASLIKNANTISLKDYKYDEVNNHITLTTRRTTYFNHLAMNRGIDFPINDNLSVRKLFEYNEMLTPLKDSKLPNQIGVNALILFNDGNTIFPKRGRNASVAKNLITSSLGIRLNISNIDHQITNEGIYEDFLGQMKKRLLFADELSLQDINIYFLGFGRDLHEGGKPQFYYLIKLPGMNSEDYTRRIKQIKKIKRKEKHTQLDFDKKVFVTKLDDIQYDKHNHIKFKECYYNKSKKRLLCRKHFHKEQPEMSFFFNLWHYYHLYFPERVRYIEKKKPDTTNSVH